MTNRQSTDPWAFPKKTVCPFCGYRCDFATPMGDDRHGPTEGSLSICLKCGELAEFKSDAEGGLEPLLGADLAEALREPSIQKMLWAWRQMVKNTGGVPNRE